MTRLTSFNLIPPSSWLFQGVGLIAGRAIIANEYRKTNKSLKNVEYNIEEFVRQWVIQQLITSYEYPEDWLGELIVVEDIIHIGSGRYRADIAVKNRNGDSIILIETKSASCAANNFYNAEQQLKSYLSATHSAIFGMLTNGYQTIFIKKRNNPNTFEIIKDLPSLTEMIEEGLFNQEDIEVPVMATTIEDKGKEDDESNNVQEDGELIYPTIEEYINAFRAIEPYMSENQKAMLKYHYHAPNQTLTMTELAKSVGYASYRGGNLQYGRLGQLLCAELDWAYGVAISILVWFTHPSKTPNRQWHLTLHPEVSVALEKLNWV